MKSKTNPTDRAAVALVSQDTPEDALAVLRLLDYAPAFSVPIPCPFGGRPASAEVEASVAVFTDTMGRFDGKRVEVAPFDGVLSAGPYVVAFPEAQTVTMCRLHPTPRGEIRVTYDSPRYRGHRLRVGSPLLRPLFHIRGALGGYRKGATVEGLLARARREGIIPTWT